MKSKLHYSLILLILSLLFILIFLSCGAANENLASESDKANECEHNYSKWQTISIATCVRDGKRVRECSLCLNLEWEQIEKRPHDAKKCKTVPATCTTEGYMVYICECGYTYNSDYVVPLGHSLAKDLIVPKTCSEAGYTHYQCERCDYNFNSDFIPQSHEFEITTTRPTASQSGFTTHTCTECSYHYDNNFIKYKEILPSPYLDGAKPIYKGIDIYDKEHESINGVYQPIDWSKVKAQGYDFVILKIGSNYSGKSVTFDMDYQGAKAAGLMVGAYYYAYSSTVADTLNDAREVLKWIEGKKFEFPIYYDIEEPSLAEKLSKEALTGLITTFIEELQANGYYSALYVNNDWLRNKLETDIILDKFDIWYARFQGPNNPVWDEAKYGKQLSMWQYTDLGIVDGFKTEIDLNLCYRDYPALMKKWGLNGFDKEPVVRPL